MAETQLVRVEEKKTYSVVYLLGAFIAGLIIGALLSFVWFKTEKRPAPSRVSVSTITTPTETTTRPLSTTSTATLEQAETIHNAGGILSIDDQPAGVSVAITQAQVSSDQWVVIRESKNGQPGNVLGAARFVGGATSGSVELLRAMSAGATYYGAIYKDNGDRTFSLADDAPVRDASGNQILVSFTAR